MHKLTLGFLFASVLAACGGNGAADEAMKQLKIKKEKVCACKDLDCARKADDEFDNWMEKNLKRLKDGDEPSKSFQKKFKDLEYESRDCMDKLRDAEAAKDAPPPAPPAEPPTAPPPADPAAGSGSAAPTP